MQDMKDNMFAETEPAQALKEIRFRDPSFDMVKFLYNLKVDVPIVIQAYLRCQIDVLKQHCSQDMVERLSGIIAAQQAQVSLPFWPSLYHLIDCHAWPHLHLLRCALPPAGGPHSLQLDIIFKHLQQDFASLIISMAFSASCVT